MIDGLPKKSVTLVCLFRLKFKRYIHVSSCLLLKACLHWVRFFILLAHPIAFSTFLDLFEGAGATCCVSCRGMSMKHTVSLFPLFLKYVVCLLFFLLGCAYTLQLFADTHPITAENFRCLCTGELSLSHLLFFCESFHLHSAGRLFLLRGSGSSLSCLCPY